MAIITVLIVAAAAAAYWLYGDQTKPPKIPLEYTILVDNLNTPWSLAFTPEGGLIFTERVGEVKLLSEPRIL